MRGGERRERELGRGEDRDGPDRACGGEGWWVERDGQRMLRWRRPGGDRRREELGGGGDAPEEAGTEGKGAVEGVVSGSSRGEEESHGKGEGTGRKGEEIKRKEKKKKGKERKRGGRRKKNGVEGHAREKEKQEEGGCETQGVGKQNGQGEP